LLAHPERLAEAYRRRLQPETRTPRTPLAALEEQLGKLRQGVARVIDSYADGLIDKGEFEPRILRLRQRMARLEEQRQQLAEEATLHTELQLIIGRLEDFAAKVHGGLEEADWASKRDLIRTLVKRVEVARDQVNIVFRVDPYAGDPDPEKKSWQLCRRRNGTPLWRASVCWREEAYFDDSCFQPLAQCGGKYGQFGQQRFMVNVVKTAAYVCIQHPWTTIFTIHSRMDSFDGVHGTASWPKTVGMGLKACFPLWLQYCFDYCLHDPVLDGRDPLSTLPLFPSYLWNM
jgi:site-specific DNA recombinase